MKRQTQNLPNRRDVLFGVGAALALLSSTALTGAAFAQSDLPDGSAFDYDSFTARMKDLAAAPYRPDIFELPDALRGLTYDEHMRIQFRPDHAVWAKDNLGFQVQAFHLGWLFKEPVKLFELVDGKAKSVTFSAADFDYHDKDTEARVATVGDFPGVAGVRLNYPLNVEGKYDELATFLGASYFRALGRNNVYGLSARGIVLNSWLEGPEEFPRFSEFYVQKPTASGEPMTVYAAMEGPSVTGAYRFVITPAGPDEQTTTMDVTARLFFRNDVKELGVAPLTSMFLFGDANRGGFDDYRPQVHDSNGLLIERETGEIMWRALNNSPALGNSYLWENNPRAFGLYQRGRDFATYQDAGAHYERRPSLRVEPSGDWGQGHVRLIEIPARFEADDNIGAFWVPEAPATAGQAREFGYKLVWGDLNPDKNAPLAYVAETRAGQGGVSGVENAANLRKFVVDFVGGELANLPAETPPDVVATVAGGVAQHTALSRIDANGAWRLVFDVETDATTPLELRAYLVGLGRQLTETWLYQWRPTS